MANLKKLWDALAAAWEQRCFEYLEKPMKLRPHVAESNMDTNKWDEQKESHARENLDILLTALEDWNSKNSLQSRKVTSTL